MIRGCGFHNCTPVQIAQACPRDSISLYLLFNITIGIVIRPAGTPVVFRYCQDFVWLGFPCFRYVAGLLFLPNIAVGTSTN